MLCTGYGSTISPLWLNEHSGCHHWRRPVEQHGQPTVFEKRKPSPWLHGHHSTENVLPQKCYASLDSFTAVVPVPHSLSVNTARMCFTAPSGSCFHSNASTRIERAARCLKSSNCSHNAMYACASAAVTRPPD